MEKLISSRSDLQDVPESFILPPETRPGNAQVSVMEDIPVIDFQQLGTDRPQLIKQIIDAAQEFGFFQLINHGVPENLLHDILDVANEFFELPSIDKASFCPGEKGKVHNWREKLRHPCHPLEEHLQAWPQKPIKYREVVGNYSVEVRKLSLCLLDLICEGLELESEFFKGELSQVQIMEQVHGLQVFKDEQWLAVEPVPNALVVNIGHTLQGNLTVEATVGDIIEASQGCAATETIRTLKPSEDAIGFCAKLRKWTSNGGVKGRGYGRF
ncbi:hypothetical protein ACLB2K_015912 [Fragaria x ananassa]